MRIFDIEASLNNELVTQIRRMFCFLKSLLRIEIHRELYKSVAATYQSTMTYASVAGNSTKRIRPAEESERTALSQRISPRFAEDQTPLGWSGKSQTGSRKDSGLAYTGEIPHRGRLSQLGYSHQSEWAERERHRRERTDSYIGSETYRRGSTRPPGYGSVTPSPYTRDRYSAKPSSPYSSGGQRQASAYGEEVQLGPRGNLQATKAQYEVGMIFRAAFHEPHRLNGHARAGSTTDLNSVHDQALAGDIRKTTSTVYGNVYSKVRPMIVVALFETTYVAVPLYTHCGNGLRNVQNPLEYVSVRDHRREGPFHKLSEWTPLVTGRMYKKSSLILEASTARLTYPVSREYDIEGTRMGWLDADSTVYLTELYNYHLPQVPSLINTKASLKLITVRLDSAKQTIVATKIELKGKIDAGREPSELVGTMDETMKAVDNILEIFQRALTLHENVPAKPVHPSVMPERKAKTVRAGLSNIEEGRALGY